MKKLLTIGLIVVVLGAAGFWFYGRDDGEEVSPYRFVTLEQGDLEAVVASTGTLNPITTVPVGTQVSGIITQIYVDFNDVVREGQIIARIDTTLLTSSLRDAQANLERVEAQLRQADRELVRVSALFEKQFVTEVEFNQAQYNYDIAVAASKSAQISLERAHQNMAYATIYAPVSGTVIERNVDVGQTVAASFSAPQLFLIGQDLAKMEILASVDESDIGMIEQGQDARFTVQAYPEESFMGKVHQVRLQSTSLENVVNYTVAVTVDNPDGRLLPGMTATVDFLIETASDVLKVPNTAIRFRPTEWMIAELREKMSAGGDSTRGREGRADAGGEGRPGGFGAAMAAGTGRPGGGSPGGGGFGGFGGGGFGGGENFAMLWYVDDAGTLAMAPVRTGITDGSMTEVMSRQLEPGLEVIAGVIQVEGGGRSLNPFQQNGGRRRPGF